MIGNLYIIKNTANSKVYIGKTYDTVDVRFKRHKVLARFGDTKKLYIAMRKHGIDNFYVESLASYEQDILELKEQELILQFDSFKNGYNSTLGGDGRRYIQISDKEILDKYGELSSIVRVANYYSIDRSSVRKVLHSNNVFPDIARRNLNKKLLIVELNKEFDSSKTLAQYLINAGISTTTLKSTQEGIRKVVRGDRKSYKNLTIIEKSR